MKTKVPFFDLSVQVKSIEDEIKSAVDEVFQSQQFIMGPQVRGKGGDHCGATCHQGRPRYDAN